MEPDLIMDCEEDYLFESLFGTLVIESSPSLPLPPKKLVPASPPSLIPSDHVPSSNEDDSSMFLQHFDLSDNDSSDSLANLSMKDPFYYAKSVINFAEPCENDPVAPESQNSYFQRLSEYRVTLSETELTDFEYCNTSLSQHSLNRLTKEISVMNKSLPCEASGSIFCCFDSKNLNNLKVIISGTEDTSYEGGLYVFHVNLPANYPLSPPKMKIVTTGTGTLRFNPNLYENGYVCLSIINTWAGNPEEMWNPEFSTLLQIFLSVQSLVMNDFLIQKEPGFEHFAFDSSENLTYLWVVRYGNLKFAILHILKNPPAEFREAVFLHFTEKKEKILEICDKWLEESKNAEICDQGLVAAHNQGVISIFLQFGVFSCFEIVINELKQELQKLSIY